jgi:hypothetical protein
MLVELFAGNYATYDGLMNVVDGIFKASTTYCDKTIIWIIFQIEILTKEKYNNYYNNINQNGHQLNLLSKI